MTDDYMKLPSTPEEWREICHDFWIKWDFPHCVGALDGKHIHIECPDRGGSSWFNRHHSHSSVLMGLADANYCFTYINIGDFGSNSDGGIHKYSLFGRKLKPPNSLGLPEDDLIRDAEMLGPLPYVVVADEAFPLQKHMLRPYPGKHAGEEERIYNYRHCRARRVIENAFGILASRWRIFHTPIPLLPSTVNQIVMACTVLHNMLMVNTTKAEMKLLRKEYNMKECEGLTPLDPVGNRATQDNVDMRNNFCEFSNEIDILPWQKDHVQRGLFADTDSDSDSESE